MTDQTSWVLEKFSDLTDWDHVLTVFERRYQHFVVKMVDWYPSGRDEFTFVLEDGNKYVYNFIDDKIRRCYVCDNYTDYTPKTWVIEFSFRMRKKMREQMLSQDDLSMITGISKVSVSKYMNGKSIPSVYNARLIAKALNCSMYELYEF